MQASSSDIKPAIRQYLTFELAGEELAIPILEVREIIEYGALTRVPQMPACVRGVINLRGSVVPVVDLAIKLGLPSSTVTRRTCVVIVELKSELERLVLGVLADSVNQVIELGAEQVQPPPLFGTVISPDYLTGMAQIGPRFALVLDVQTMLSVAELLQPCRVDSSAAAPGSATVAADVMNTAAADSTSTREPSAGAQGGAS